MVQVKKGKKKATGKVAFIFSASKRRYVSMLEKIAFKRIEFLGDQPILVTKNDTYQAILKIKTRNIYSISGEEQVQLMDSFTMFCRMYVDDFCIYSLMFAANTDELVNFWTYKLQQAVGRKSEVQTKICNEQIFKMIWVAKNIANLEFYMALYGDTPTDLADKIKLATWNGGTGIQLEKLDEKEVEKLIFKLNNMCTEV